MDEVAHALEPMPWEASLESRRGALAGIAAFGLEAYTLYGPHVAPCSVKGSYGLVALIRGLVLLVVSSLLYLYSILLGILV